MARPRRPSASRAKQLAELPRLADAPPPREKPHPPTHEEIQVRAYCLWSANASGDSDPVSDWLKAEREMWDEYSRDGLEDAAAPSVEPRPPEWAPPDRSA